MILSGLGLYMGYIPFTYLIERLIASLRVVSTAVFIIYLADSFGYLGTTGVFMVKNFVSADISWTVVLPFFQDLFLSCRFLRFTVISSNN